MIFSEHRNQSIPALSNKKLRILPHSLFCLNLQFDTKKVKMKEVNITAANQKEYLLRFYREGDSAFRFALLGFIFPSSRAVGQKRQLMRISITLCVLGRFSCQMPLLCFRRIYSLAAIAFRVLLWNPYYKKGEGENEKTIFESNIGFRSMPGACCPSCSGGKLS